MIRSKVSSTSRRISRPSVLFLARSPRRGRASRRWRTPDRHAVQRSTTIGRAGEEAAPHGEVFGQLVGGDERARGPFGAPPALGLGRHCPTSSARQQRDARAPPSKGSSSGSSLAHFSIAIGQRSWKRQPRGSGRGREPRPFDRRRESHALLRAHAHAAHAWSQHAVEEPQRVRVARARADDPPAARSLRSSPRTSRAYRGSCAPRRRSQVVRDEQDAHPHLALQLPQPARGSAPEWSRRAPSSARRR